jgi:anaerobic ribonucleoside-triphosphate reductase activating protein
MNSVSLSSYVVPSQANGPGDRFVLWVQGCSLHCKGCWNGHTWSKEGEGIQNLSVDELWEMIQRHRDIIEGVTFTGGEPLEQVRGLMELAKRISDSDLSLVLFTGYYPVEWTEEQRQLVNLTDIVIAGRYIEALRTDGEGMKASSNQEIVFVSSRYQHDDVEKTVEFWIDETGNVQVTGFPVDFL